MQITDNFSSRFYLKTIRRKQPWEKTASPGSLSPGLFAAASTEGGGRIFHDLGPRL